MNDQTINFKKCRYEISYYFIIFHTFTLCTCLCSYIYAHIYFVWFGLKQVVNEACNNTKNCKMIMMSSFKLTKNLNEEEQGEKKHLKSYTLFCKTKMKEVIKQS